MGWYIGIDGGGTKTAFCLGKEDGKPLYCLRKTGCSYQSIGVEAVADLLKNGVLVNGERITDGNYELTLEKMSDVTITIDPADETKQLTATADEVDEEIATLCDIAMCGDHGIGECYGAVLDLPKCIAKGDDMCCLRYHKKETK